MSATLIKPVIKDEVLVQEADRLLSDQHRLYGWWLGQSGFLLQWNGRRVLVDPYLSDSLTQKYAGTDKAHIRMSERVVDPVLLKNISIVSSSHNHTDHLDAATLLPVFENNPGITFIIPEANRDFVAERLHCKKDFPQGLGDSQSLSVHDVVFHGIPAKHNEIDRDANGNCLHMGYVIELGGYKIYHSGDTLWFDELVALLKPFKVDVAILPINGDQPERRVAGNLNGPEAVKLAKAIDAKLVIPCHYNMFYFNTASTDDFINAAEAAEQPCRILALGEKFECN